MRKYDFANIATRPFPTLSEVLNPYIFGGVKTIVNVSEREDINLINYYKANSIDYYHFPLQECVSDMGWKNIIECTKIIIENIRANIPTIVHCIGGNNRSPLIVECAYYAIYGHHFVDDYKGATNHLLYSIEQGYLPLTVHEIEDKLSSLAIENN